MRATVRPPLIRAGPGVSAWTALPERDRALLLWLVQGDVVTAELAALLAYGHRRIAQRRLARLRDYGLLAGFWAANRQRPRGRYAYTLTKIARAQLERLVWPLGKPKLDEGAIETVSPVIHQLATHDLFMAFLRAADPGAETGLAGWVPERALVRLTGSGYLRPDALAIVRHRDAMIVLFIERDLGTERGAVLVDKVRRYRNMYAREKDPKALHVGIVVDSQRRAHAVRRILRAAEAKLDIARAVRVWVTTEAELTADPHGAVWISPAVDAVRTIDLEPHPIDEHWPILGPLCLATPDTLDVLDERVLAALPVLAGLR
jgi:hypothetical protein